MKNIKLNTKNMIEISNIHNTFTKKAGKYGLKTLQFDNIFRKISNLSANNEGKLLDIDNQKNTVKKQGYSIVKKGNITDFEATFLHSAIKLGSKVLDFIRITDISLPANDKYFEVMTKNNDSIKIDKKSSYIFPILDEISNLIKGTKKDETLFVRGSKFEKLINQSNLLQSKSKVKYVAIKVDKKGNSYEIIPSFLKTKISSNNNSKNGIAALRKDRNFNLSSEDIVLLNDILKKLVDSPTNEIHISKKNDKLEFDNKIEKTELKKNTAFIDNLVKKIITKYDGKNNTELKEMFVEIMGIFNRIHNLQSKTQLSALNLNLSNLKDGKWGGITLKAIFTNEDRLKGKNIENEINLKVEKVVNVALKEERITKNDVKRIFGDIDLIIEKKEIKAKNDKTETVVIRDEKDIMGELSKYFEKINNDPAFKNLNIIKSNSANLINTKKKN